MRWRLLLLVLACGALLAPLPPAAVERLYSRGLFPILQPALTTASNTVPLALFDLLIAGVVMCTVAFTWRDLRRVGWRRAGARLALRLLTVGAALYLAFLLAWGLNYRRTSLKAKLLFSPEQISTEQALVLARETVARMNGLHDEAHARGWRAARDVDDRLAAALREGVQAVRHPAFTVPARPKYTVLDWYFRRTGVSGMTDPFFLETLLPSTLLPFERPFVVAHEWSHLAGFTDEGEANFVAWLACLRGDAGHQYSAWVSIYGEVLAAVPRTTQAEVARSLEAGPRADLEAIRLRLVRDINPRLSAAGWQAYDQYLKANRVDAGTASYAEVVQLILGTGIR